MPLSGFLLRSFIPYAVNAELTSVIQDQWLHVAFDCHVAIISSGTGPNNLAC